MNLIGTHENHKIYYDYENDNICCKNFIIKYKEILHAYKSKKDRTILEKGDEMTFTKNEIGCNIGCFFLKHEEIKNLIINILNIKSKLKTKK